MIFPVFNVPHLSIDAAVSRIVRRPSNPLPRQGNNELGGMVGEAATTWQARRAMRTTTGAQLSLFGREAEVRCDPLFSRLERTELADGAWVEKVPGWVSGHARLFDDLLARAPWREEERTMYEHRVLVPRLLASVEGALADLEIIRTMRAALDARYRTEFARTSLALYRDGADGVAWHGDYVARRLPEALVATISLGAPRKLLLRKAGGGASIALSLGDGDLLVMGGSCQRTHQHAVPKVANAEPRIALMFRPVWE